MQVHALYAFTSGGDGELSFEENEYLTIIRQDIGEGWWEAKNSYGVVGLVPESYLEEVFPEPTMPPPPVPQPSYPSYQPPPPQPEIKPSFTKKPVLPHKQESVNQEEWDEDEWDEDEFDDATSTRSSQSHVNNDYKLNDNKTVGKKFGGKFSGFSKAGGDAYLFEEISDSQQSSVQVTVSEGVDGRPQWDVGANEPYTCDIKSPKKESKYHGMKSFIVYQITPTITNIQVSRRYKHFDWLHARLEEKFTTLTIPPLPDKQVTGRYQTDFIEQRMQQLRKWIDRMCRHPVVARSDVFIHFMTIADEKLWKTGKRKAEKDDFKGAKFFIAVASPSRALESPQLENEFEQFGRFVKSMDDSVRQLSTIGEQNIKRRREPFKKDFLKMGQALCGLSKAFEYDDRPHANKLTNAIDNTGRNFESISDIIDSQPSKDIIPMLESMHEYKGILSTFPDTLAVYRTATQKIQEVGGKLSDNEITRANKRAEVIGYSTLAEINHFQNDRIVDFNDIMKNYLKQQITMFQQITQKLQSSLEKFE